MGLRTNRIDASVRSRRESPMRGFTLVEALVVMAIVAILTALAVPSFQEFVASRAVNTQISDFSSSLRLARTEAIKRGRPVVICRSNDTQAAAPVCDAGATWNSGWLILQGNNLIRTQARYRDSGGIVSQAGLNSITFTQTGIAPAASETIFTFQPPLPTTHSSYTPLTKKICVSVTGVTRSC